MMETNFDLPGWATAIDQRTGRQYFINLVEKTTTWDDPRLKIKHMPPIPMQTLSVHGSPKKVQVYPTQSYPTQAFQSTSGHSVHASPVPSSKASQSQYSHSQSHHTQVEMSSLSRSSPHTPRVGSLIKHQQLLQQQQNIQETSFTTPTPHETDAVVAKINSMFPTASEHHIRLLLKKYHNREAVVISALQVEKHPTHTPGPNTPPPPRSFHTTAMVLSAFTPPSSSLLSRKGLHHLYNDHLTINSSVNGSPIRPHSTSSYYTSGYTYGSPRYGEQLNKNSPKPHSSPKMKLRYLKSQFPKCEETIILDVLATVENNVQKATEQLTRMGYEKREITPAPRLSHRKKEGTPVAMKEAEPTPPPKPKSAEEKKKLKSKLESQFESSIPPRVISMALESVDYSEEKALKILEIVLQEDKDTKRKTEEKKDKKRDAVEKNVSFKEPSLKSSKSIDLDKAAAIENDETIIINSDHSIITTPIETPQSDENDSTMKHDHHQRKIESDETTPTSDGSEMNTLESKGKKKRHKARSDSTRSTKNEAKKSTDKKIEETKPIIVNKTILLEETTEGNYMSIITKAQGPSGIAKGPRDDLLLADYVAWSGANPDIVGKKMIAKGPNAALRVERTYVPRGASGGLCKGAKVGLAIGSIYSQGNRPNVACN